jgi:peptidoglycan/xylan/chitin deacetylase (PgdA/CDA1 family)
MNPEKSVNREWTPMHANRSVIAKFSFFTQWVSRNTIGKIKFGFLSIFPNSYPFVFIRGLPTAVFRKNHQKQYIILTALLLVCFAASAADRKAINKIPNHRKAIALTFDDGPNNKITKPILEILERHQVKATFFQVGKNINAYPELSRQVASRGHEIGNHSMTHARLPELTSQKDIEAEIRGFQTLAKSTIGSAPKVFRAPYLKFDERVWTVLDDLGLPAFNASVYADYKGNDDLNNPSVASAHADTIVAKVNSGSIILMHERAITLHYLDEVISKLKNADFSFVTVSELQAGNR